MTFKTKTRATRKKKRDLHLPMPQKSRFIGIDQSLSCTGVVVCDLQCRIKMATCISTSPKGLPEERLDWIGMCFDRILAVHGEHLKFVAIENLAYGGSGKMDILSGVYWELRRRIWRYRKDLDIRSVYISSWKKAIAGHGKATKPMIKAAIEEKYGLTFDSEDCYDAYGLLRFEWEKWNEKEEA